MAQTRPGSLKSRFDSNIIGPSHRASQGFHLQHPNTGFSLEVWGLPELVNRPSERIASVGLEPIAASVTAAGTVEMASATIGPIGRRRRIQIRPDTERIRIETSGCRTAPMRSSYKLQLPKWAVPATKPSIQEREKEGAKFHIQFFYLGFSMYKRFLH
ncbi:hypothetical protein ABFS83_13G050900 [Erythranthe nasuta]